MFNHLQEDVLYRSELEYKSIISNSPFGYFSKIFIKHFQSDFQKVINKNIMLI